MIWQQDDGNNFEQMISLDLLDCFTKTTTSEISGQDGLSLIGDARKEVGTTFDKMASKIWHRNPHFRRVGQAERRPTILRVHHFLQASHSASPSSRGGISCEGAHWWAGARIRSLVPPYCSMDSSITVHWTSCCVALPTVTSVMFRPMTCVDHTDYIFGLG